MPASSLVSNPTRTLGSVCRGNLRSTASSVAGLSFAAHPAALAIEVSFTDEAKPHLAVNHLDYSEVTRFVLDHLETLAQESISQTKRGIRSVLVACQPAAASVDFFAGASVAAPTVLAVISSPFLFISNLCLRSKPLTNSRVALATPPGRLDASTLTVDSTVPSVRS